MSKSQTNSGRWADLAPRVVSGALMAVLGVAAIRLGGIWFQGMIALVIGIMIWELSQMLAPKSENLSIVYGGLGGILMLAAPSLDLKFISLLATLFAVFGMLNFSKDRALFAVFLLALLTAGIGLIGFRATHGGTWLFWLVLVVIITDVAGYFAGRILGGPKFWPRVSPKKTWSGTIAGWVGALGVGALFLTFTRAGADLLWISVLLAFASQMGDIAESALKRRVGVKDSSALIPGHGGMFDRFDGVLGAVLFMLLVAMFVDVPGVSIR